MKKSVRPLCVALAAVLIIAGLPGCIKLPVKPQSAPDLPVIQILEARYPASIPCTLSVVANDHEGDPVAYQLELSCFLCDTLLEPWTAYYPSGMPILFVLTERSAYDFRARARDSENAVTEFCPLTTIEYEYTLPWAPFAPTGEPSQFLGIADTFWCRIVNPDGGQVSARFDPGTGPLPVWSAYFASGLSVGFIHTYFMTGEYAVRMQARDVFENLSQWSDPLILTVRVNPDQLGRCDISGGAQRVVAAGNYAYVATASNGLRIVDATSLTSPRVVASTAEAFAAAELGVSGTRIFVLVSAGTSAAEVISYDMADPLHPLRGAELSLPQATCLAVDETTAIVGTASGGSSLRVIDLANPDSLRVAATLGIGSVQSVALKLPFAYVVTADHVLRVVELTNPYAPVFAGTLQLNDGGPIGVSRNRVRVPFGDSLQVINVVDPQAPRWVSTRPLKGPGQNVHSIEDYSAIAEAPDAFELWDLNGGSPPPIVARLRIGGSCEAVWCGERALFVANGTAGLRIYEYPVASSTSARQPLSPPLNGAYSRGDGWELRLIAADGIHE